MAHGIELQQVTKQYGDAKSPLVVKGVDLTVPKGTLTTILGPSGCGKTTLLRMIAGLDAPTAGRILIDGQDVTTLGPAERNVSMVFQSYALFPHMNVLANVCYGLVVQGMAQAEAEQRARATMDSVGLAGYDARLPSELSGGQQQRVGIARSLAVGPDVWFLDEPFSALDPLIRREMQDEFLRLQRLLKKTIVFITHDFDEAIRLADRIGIMKDGKLVQLATPEEMFTNPADDYVKAFTRNAPRDRIVSVGAIA
jgi:ABC-type proline/glycine betaine transport system ATPase subunit